MYVFIKADKALIMTEKRYMTIHLIDDIQATLIK